MGGAIVLLASDASALMTGTSLTSTALDRDLSASVGPIASANALAPGTNGCGGHELTIVPVIASGDRPSVAGYTGSARQVVR